MSPARCAARTAAAERRTRGLSPEAPGHHADTPERCVVHPARHGVDDVPLPLVAVRERPDRRDLVPARQLHRAEVEVGDHLTAVEAEHDVVRVASSPARRRRLREARPRSPHTSSRPLRRRVSSSRSPSIGFAPTVGGRPYARLTRSERELNSSRRNRRSPHNAVMATVLVVDDEPIVREVVVRYLSRDGHRTLEAARRLDGARDDRAVRARSRRARRDAAGHGRARALSLDSLDARSSR